MLTFQPPDPVTALVYPDGFAIDALLRRIVDHLLGCGRSVAGFVQVNEARAGRSRCDMVLEDIASGERLSISENRGAHARGCLLDMQQLARAEVLAERALDGSPDLLVINKFGRSEAQGRGFRPLIAAAIERGVPVLIAVPARNLDSWRRFTDGISLDWLVGDLTGDPAALTARFGLTGPSDLGAVEVAATAGGRQP